MGVVQLIVTARAEEEVGERYRLSSRARGRGYCWLGCTGWRSAEGDRVGVVSILRMKVIDRDLDVLIFVAELQTVGATQPGVVDLWIDHKGVLHVRARGLTAKAAEVVHSLCIESARDARVGRNVWDSGLGQKAGLPNLSGRLRKDNILALKLDRGETEIITFSARRQRVDVADGSSTDLHSVQTTLTQHQPKGLAA